MTLIKIPRYYLISEDKNEITVDVPDSILRQWKGDRSKIIQAKGILKHKKEALLAHLDTIRDEWEK